jgi:caffeoyl-CoA O-methyltransferase
VPQSFGITDASVEQYLDSMVPARSEVLRQMEDHAARENVPIIGPVEGQFLYVLALGAKAHDILEVGTATGYSGLWLGMAAGARGGRLVSLERDEGRAALAEAFWRQADMAGVCTVRQGEAFTTLAGMSEGFDLVFVDILTQQPNTEQADHLFELCLARLRPGGLLVADNALRKGQVADATSHDPGVQAVRHFLHRAFTHPDLTTTIVPLRDGVCIAVRRASEGGQD